MPLKKSFKKVFIFYFIFYSLGLREDLSGDFPPFLNGFKPG